MDENTQQNTQRVDSSDPEKEKRSRKVEDECNILCRLFPSSSSAYKAVELVSECSPNHIHVNDDQNDPQLLYNPPTKGQPRDSDSEEVSPIAPKPPKQYPDIALRMSSNVRDPRMGFVFGRNPKKCDIMLSEDSKRLSAAHFRIFINQNGLLMLEDMSTNGTMVDKVMLRGMKTDQTQPNLPSTRTLDNGSIIELPIVSEKNEEWMRFIVLIPKRDDGHSDYERNLTEYLERIQQDERRAEIARRANVAVPLPQTMPFAPLQKTARKESPTRTSVVAARGQSDYGMKWNGGDKYNVVGYIGSGAFAMVYKLSTVQHGEVYACKQIEKRRYIKNGQAGKNMHNELGIMKRISHTNIVQFVESHETDRYIFIIMEFVSLGDLTVYTSDDRVMHEHMGQQVAAQIGKALHYLHGQDVVHRDVKPDNILIANHNPYVFKLSDFGLSKVVTKEDYMRTFCGTILYCAPEIYPSYKRAMAGIVYGKRGRHLDHPREETQPYKCSVDTWGIAAVLFHLLSGHPPWTGTVEDNGSVMLGTIISTAPDWEKLTLAGVSRLAIDFLRRMLQIFPDKRATDEQVLAHRWIRRIVSADNGDEDQNEANNSIQGDVDIPDASQLDINDKASPQIFNDAHNVAGSHDGPDENMTHLEPIDAIQSSELWQYWDPGSTTIPEGMLHPTIPQTHMQPPRPTPQASTRLFGEIPESALQSSGILGQNANKALDIQDSQMEDRELLSDTDSLRQVDLNGHEEGEISSLNEEELEGLEEDMTDLEEKIINALQKDSMSGLQNGNGESFDNEESEQDLSSKTQRSARRSARRRRESAQPRAPHPRDFANVVSPRRRPDKASSSKGRDDNHSGQTRTGNAPNRKPQSLSLQGTESLVEDLTMVSTAPGLSGASEDGPSVGTPDRSTHEEYSNHEEDEPSTVNPRSKRSSQHLPPSPSQEARSKRSRTLAQPTRHSSATSTDRCPDEARSRRSRHTPPSFSDSSPNRLSSYQLYKLAKAVTPPAHPGPNLPTDDPPTSASLTTATPSNPTSPVPLGVLVPMPNSIPTLASIPLTRRVTTFGRNPKSNTHPHPGNDSTPNWSRIGRNAMDLTFWYPGIEAQLASNTLPADWHTNPSLRCLISTRTSRYILINGTKLTRGVTGWNYGVLRTGDVVTVVQPDLEREIEHEHERLGLAFRCEFSTGLSKKARGEDGKEPFFVETETVEWEKMKKGGAAVDRSLFRRPLADKMMEVGPGSEEAKERLVGALGTEGPVDKRERRELAREG